MDGLGIDPIRFRRVIATSCLLLASLLLASCGGGSASPATAPAPPAEPAASFNYPTPQVYVVGTEIAPLAPVVKGSLSQFHCLALPPGLVLDSATGVISGRPTAAEASSNYTIDAVDPSAKGVSTEVNLTINAVGPGTLSYGASVISFTAGVPSRMLTPEVVGTVTGWSITPQLPLGLTFNTADGSITGTPTAAVPRTPYTVTAQGSSGTLSVTFAIEVDKDVVVDLGHSAPIRLLQFNGSTVLSEDDKGRWVLWDYGTGAMLASGDAAYGDCVRCGYSVPGDLASLAGPTAVIRTLTGLQVRSAVSGALTANISTTLDWWNLATDGSYIVAGSATALNVWSPSGQLLFTRPGNYAYATGYASPGVIRMANGPAGTNVLETVSVPEGADAITPKFQGQFASWFLDGSGFISIVYTSPEAAPTLLLYSDNAVQEASIDHAVIDTSSGIPAKGTYVQGSWLWTFSGSTLSVYPFASPTTPIATYTFADGSAAMPSASTIGVWDPTNSTLGVIDLSGVTPVRTEYTSPFGVSDEVGAYAAASATRWISGYGYGVLLDGASSASSPRFFNYGEALSVVGNGNRIAVATASGRILYFNAVTLAQEGTISFSTNQITYSQYVSLGNPAPQLALSSDGSTLAFLAPGGLSINIYSLPSGTLLYSWPYPPSAGLFALDIALSGSGTVLGTTAQYLPVGYVTQTASAATGGPPIFSSRFLAPNSSPPPLRLSPDGTQIATSEWGNPDVVPSDVKYETNIMRNGVIVPFVRGWPVGWLDDTHLLVNTYIVDRHSDTQGDYAGCTIYDLTGTSAGTCALPEVLGFQTVNSDTLYSLNNPEMVSLSTGTVSWMSGDNLPGSTGYIVGPSFPDALSGARVVLVSDSRLLAQSY